MDDLSLTSVSGLTNAGLPYELAFASLWEGDPKSIVSIAPFKGQGMGVNAALQQAVKLTLPKTGEAETSNEFRALWVGQNVWFILGAPHEILRNALEGKAAVIDQSDAWSVLNLSGDIAAILARLTSLDFSKMQKNQTARTEFSKISVILSLTDNGVEIMVPRSSALWAVRQIKRAMLNLSNIHEMSK